MFDCSSVRLLKCSGVQVFNCSSFRLLKCSVVQVLRDCHNNDLGSFHTDYRGEFYTLKNKSLYRYFPEYTDSECLLSTSQNENIPETVKIYPNPVFSGQDIVIEHTGNKVLQIEIIDQLGRILAKYFTSETTVSALSIPDMKSGTYFIRISDKETGKQIIKLLAII